MPRKFVLLVGFAVFSSVLFAQQSLPDSLRRIYSTEKDLVKKADAYFQLADLLVDEKPERGALLADTLEQMGQTTRNPKILSRASHLRGQMYYHQGKYHLALPFYREALNFANKTKDPELQGRAYNAVGSCFHDMVQNDSALVYLMKAARLKEQVGNKKDIAAAYSNIGNVFSDELAYEKAIEWLEKALAIRLSLPNGEKGAIVTYNNLSVAYNGKGDLDKALEYAQKGIKLALETGNKLHAGVIYGGIGHLTLKKGKLDEAIGLCEQSVKLLTEINRKPNLVFPLANLSEAWWRKGNYAKALEINNQGYAIMQELKLLQPLEVYYENYMNIYEATGDYKQALSWFKKFVILDDSLFNAEKIERIAAVEAKFETEKKEAQLVKQQLEIAKKDNLRNQILFAAIGVILALFGVFQYLRNRQKVRQKEAELKALLEHAEAEKLRETDALKSTFFANISHEFRTPLTLIISPLEQLLNGTFKGDVRKYYGIMHRNGRRLLQLVNQLLDLSKLESGKMKLETEAGDLTAFVRAIAYSFESLAVRKLVDYRVLTPPTAITGFFDRDKLEKILTNLLSNAFKFTPENGTIELEMKTPESGSSGLVEISVTDTGIGIPADQVPYLFDRFYSGSSQTPRKTGTASPKGEDLPFREGGAGRHPESIREEADYAVGTGIGLALTRELVLLHKGQIQVESEEGRGTCFSFTFFVENLSVNPQSAPSIPPEDKKAPKLPAEATLLSEKPKMAELLGGSERQVILIVEDNPDVRQYIRDQLSETYQVMEAGNGKQGLEMAIEITPDLVVSDIMMPEMDGREFCRLVKSNEKTSHIPVVLLTAKADQADKLEGLSLGADDYLIKPFDTRELQVRVANLIEQRRHLQERYRRSLHAFAPAEVELESIDSAFLQKVREAVETNLEDETFSVVELGAAVNMSRSQLHRKLKALTGYAPNEVIRNMRLERARAMLEKRTGNASEVAYMTGFNSPAYFAKCFKDYFGISPSEV